MKKLKIIVNNRAGKRAFSSMIQDAKHKMWGWDLEFVFPESPDQTREACRTASACQVDALVIAGGDGTFNQALPALIGNPVPVVPFPSGTANDLATELGIAADWVQIQQLLNNQQIRQIDLVRVNDRYFATVGGLGLGADLVSRVNDLRQRSPIFQKVWYQLKSEMYGLMAASLILTGQSPLRRMTISCDGFNKTLPVSSLFIANQGLLGGDIAIAPKAINDDGVFDVVILALSNRLELMRSMLGAKIGQSFPANHRFSTQSLRVEMLDGQGVDVFGDGELLTNARVLNFELMPAALRVFAPSRATGRRLYEKAPI